MGEWKDVNKAGPCSFCGENVRIVQEWIKSSNDIPHYYPHYLNMPREQMSPQMLAELAKAENKRYFIIDNAHQCPQRKEARRKMDKEIREMEER